MITLNTLSPKEGARKQKKRVGRGPGSGHGKTASRGHKGARSRAGYSMRSGFEGGQMPLHRRLPKRGFRNIFKKTYYLLSLDTLDSFDNGATVNKEVLVQAGIVQEGALVKVLANGEINKAIHVQVDKVSQGAKEKIIAAGGTVAE